MSCIGGRKKDKKSSKDSNGSSASLKTSSRQSTLRKTPSNGSLDSSKALKSQKSSKSLFAKQKEDTTKKSPIKQMREEFDELKLKKEEQDRLIAAQAAELELLKKQLATPIPTPTPDNSEETLRILQERETALRSKERELEEIRETLEQERLNTIANSSEIPAIVISEEEVKNLKEQNEEAMNLLARQEQMLAEKEQELEGLRVRLEDEAANALKPALEDVNKQLAALREENSDAIKRLSEKEREVETLKSQLNPDEPAAEKQLRRLTIDLEAEHENLARLASLEAELEAQKHQHEQILMMHNQAIAEKDSLLKKHTEALAKVQTEHEIGLKELQRQQETALKGVEAQHAAEMAQLREKVDKAEASRNGGTGKNFTDEDVEKLLSEFEQTQYTHENHVAALQKSYATQLSNLQQTHSAQISTLRKTQTKEKNRLSWRSSVLPPTGGGMPWPLQGNPMAMLRKTNVENRPTSSWAMAMREGANYDLWPEDAAKVQIYGSSVSGSFEIKKNQEHLKQVLLTNKVAFEFIDVAASEASLKHMHKKSGLRDLPQIFVGGEFRGLYSDFLKAHQDNNISEFLKPADITPEQRAASREAQKASEEAQTISFSPRTLRDRDDDEEMFRELEKDINEGKLRDSFIEQL